jgi:hypothetical protein
MGTDFPVYYQGGLITVLDEGHEVLSEATEVYETILPHTNMVVMCFRCGETWMKMTVATMDEQGKTLPTGPYYPYGGVCRACGDGSLLQWGVLHHRRDQKQWGLESKLVRRELELIWEKENGNEAQNV